MGQCTSLTKWYQPGLLDYWIYYSYRGDPSDLVTLSLDPVLLPGTGLIKYIKRSCSNLLNGSTTTHREYWAWGPLVHAFVTLWLGQQLQWYIYTAFIRVQATEDPWRPSIGHYSKAEKFHTKTKKKWLGNPRCYYHEDLSHGETFPRKLRTMKKKAIICLDCAQSSTERCPADFSMSEEIEGRKGSSGTDT